MPPVVLCATDLGTSGRRCADLASDIAHALGAEVVLLYVGEPQTPPPVDPVPAEVRPAAEALRRRLEARRVAHENQLEAECARVRDRGIVCRGVLREGRPWEEILHEADAVSPRLLVVGPHGDPTGELLLDGLRARLLGSTADRVVRHAQRPVLVAPAHDHEHPDGPIVVGLDLSEVAEHAAVVAGELAAALGRGLVLVHALPETTDEDGMEHADYASLLHDHAEREARDHLGRVARAVAADPQVQVAPIAGTPSETLLGVAGELGASWMALGTHGRTGLARWVLGSTAERVLHRADRPVLVIPHPEGKAQS